MTIQDYQNLVTSEYKDQPKFIAMIGFVADVCVQIQSLLGSMIPIFDLDLPPVGNQLDIVGQWVGVSRNVSIPIANVYFSWDATAALGWDFGSWQPGNAPVNITVLPDDAYLNLIRARIAANQWDGTTEGAYAIWENIFPTFQILIQDHNNMSYDLAIVGGIVDSLTLALIVGGYIPLRPEGVQVANYLVSVDTNPAFAWDTENTFLQGWDQGSWLRIVPAT
jgi:hypothetical protein